MHQIIFYPLFMIKSTNQGAFRWIINRIILSYPKPTVQILIITNFYSSANLIFPGFDDSLMCFQYLEGNKAGKIIK